MDSDSYEANIEDLPDEVLRHIFLFLSPKMIKTCNLVSKRWNTVITSSREIMNHFVLDLESRDNTEINMINKLERKQLYAVKCSDISPAIKEIISFYQLRHLHISSCSVNANDLNECLERLTLLESFVGQTIRIQEKSQLRRIKFAKLKELRVEYSDIELILMFDTESLEILQIAPSSKEERGSAILHILKKQRKLRHLSVGGYFSDNFLNLHGIYDFAVGTLKRFRFERGPMGDIPHKNLIKFLSTHRDTLTSVELIYPYDISVYIYTHNSMKNVKYLDIPVTELSEMPASTFRQLTANNNIKRIRFVGHFKSLERANAIFDLFPSLVSIDLSGFTTPTYFMQILHYLSQTKRQLAVLKIPSLQHNYNNDIFFPNLKEFVVKRVPDQNHYNSFIGRHAATLESITIDTFDCDYLRGLVIEEIIECPNIKFISIGAKTSVVLRKFEKLIAKDKEWKLSLNLKGPSGLKFAKVQFNFPQDRAVFKEGVMIHSDEYIKTINTLDDMGLNRFINKFK